MVLVLPCDWRFLPKLGLRAVPAARAFFFYGLRFALSIGNIDLFTDVTALAPRYLCGAQNQWSLLRSGA